jgi:uncharacterized Ntn-hydrolase superfamily protein
MSAARMGTFSIVAHDPQLAAWGIAVQSRFISVGAVVPFAKAGVGAVATQALANTAYGKDGLAQLRAGRSAEEVVRRLTEGDAERDHRQVGVVDAKGRAATFTGRSCLEWAGGEAGDGFACQGNILFGAEVVRSMAKSFRTSRGDLLDRLLAALAAGQREGGDRRGMQSAALFVVKEGGGYGGRTDRWVDIRVDDHPSPIEELQRVFRLYDLTMLSREDPKTLRRIEGDVAAGLQHDLSVLGYYTGRLTGAWEASSQAAFDRFVSEHNFENKQRTDGTVWPSIIAYLKERAAAETARRTRTAPIVPGALERGPGAGAPQGGSPSGPNQATQRSSK